MLQLIHKEVIVPDDAELFFVGDIHGSYDLLMDTLRLAGFDNSKDYCICAGDLIDRGPDNYKVLAKFLYGDERFQTVLGNHDAFMGYWKIEQTFATWLYNGGAWIIDDGLDTDQLNALSEDIRQRVPVFMTVKHRGYKYGVVHAGIPNIYRGNGVAVAGYEGLMRNWDDVISDVGTFIKNNGLGLASVEHLISPYMWDRDVLSGYQDGINYPPVAGVDLTIHGHTYVADPVLYKNRLYLDTGGVFNGQLTVARVVDNNITTMTSLNTATGIAEVKHLTLGALND